MTTTNRIFIPHTVSQAGAVRDMTPEELIDRVETLQQGPYTDATFREMFSCKEAYQQITGEEMKPQPIK